MLTRLGAIVEVRVIAAMRLGGCGFEMLGVEARSIQAAVVDLVVVRDWADKEVVGEPMNEPLVVPDRDMAVAVVIYEAEPDPAAVLVDLVAHHATIQKLAEP